MIADAEVDAARVALLDIISGHAAGIHRPVVGGGHAAALPDGRSGQALFGVAHLQGVIAFQQCVVIRLGDPRRGAHAQTQIPHLDRITAQDNSALAGAGVLHALFQLHIRDRQADIDLADLIFLNEFIGRLFHAGIRRRFLVVAGQVERVDLPVAGDAGSRDGFQIIILVFFGVHPEGVDVGVDVLDIFFLGNVQHVEAVGDFDAAVYGLFFAQHTAQAVERPYAVIDRGEVVAVAGQQRSTDGHRLRDRKRSLGIVTGRNVKRTVSYDSSLEFCDGLAQRRSRERLDDAVVEGIRDVMRIGLDLSVNGPRHPVDAEQLPVFVPGRGRADESAFGQQLRMETGHWIDEGQVIRTVFFAADGAAQGVFQRAQAVIADGGHIGLV